MVIEWINIQIKRNLKRQMAFEKIDSFLLANLLVDKLYDWARWKESNRA